jgi:hypothetical protein
MVERIVEWPGSHVVKRRREIRVIQAHLHARVEVADFDELLRSVVHRFGERDLDAASRVPRALIFSREAPATGPRMAERGHDD